MLMRILGSLTMVMAVTLPAQAAPFVLDFEGLDDLELVAGFYGGGTSEHGNTGVDYGVNFSGTGVSIIDADAGGSGSFANEPTPDTAMFFFSNTGSYLNVVAGFDTSFGFFYSVPDVGGQVRVYSGLDGTGDLLATIATPATGSSCGGDPTGLYNCWAQVGATFAGLAHSVSFNDASFVLFDDVSFGAGGERAPVPEPGLFVLTAAGLAAAVARRRRLRG